MGPPFLGILDGVAAALSTIIGACVGLLWPLINYAAETVMQGFCKDCTIDPYRGHYRNRRRSRHTSYDWDRPRGNIPMAHYSGSGMFGAPNLDFPQTQVGLPTGFHVERDMNYGRFDGACCPFLCPSK